MLTSLTGKRVVVIGGASGIGFAVAALAHELDANVLIATRNAENVDRAVARLPGATGRTVDLRDESDVARSFDEIGPFDHLVVTAGDWGGSMFVATTQLDFSKARESLTVRFWGSLLAAKYGCRTIARDGSITLTSGLLAHHPAKGAPLATAIGGAMEHLARGLAVDLAPIRVNAVCPGVILSDHVRETMPEARLQASVSPLPVPRAGTPEEAAHAYIYCMLNRYVTGSVIPVEGGALLV